MVSTLSKPIHDAIHRETLKKNYKQLNASNTGSQNFTEKARQLRQQSKQNQRYLVTAKRRGLSLDELVGTSTTEGNTDIDKPTVSPSSSVDIDDVPHGSVVTPFHLYDVVKDDSSGDDALPNTSSHDPSTIACNGVAMVKETIPQASARSEISIAQTSRADYVYDLYYLNHDEMDFHALESILAIEACADEYLHSYRDDGGMFNVDEDDSDSNDEDNWRNDYPDSDPDTRNQCNGYGSQNGEEKLFSEVMGMDSQFQNIGNWSTDSEEDLYDKCGSPSNYFDSVQTPCELSYEKYLRKLRKMRNKHEDDDSESDSDSDDN